MRVVTVTLLFAVMTLSGCVSSDLEDVRPETAAPDQTPLALRPVENLPLSEYLHDLSPARSEWNVGSATMIHLRTQVDEFIELDTWIAVPQSKEPVPVILEVTPYYAGGNPQPADVLQPSQYAIEGQMPFNRLSSELVQRGYAVGISSVRGTGNSGGCFTQGGPQEARDTATVVEHVADQEWSNGNVGIIGVSYPGTTPQDVWVEAPPALKAIVPISGISDMYKYNFVNGVPINVQGFGFNTYYWALTGAVPFPLGVSGLGPATDPVGMVSAVPGEACPEQIDVQEGGVSSTIDGNKDDYWKVRDFRAEALANPIERPAVWYIHGLQDWNVKPHNIEDWLPHLQESGSEYKVWLGQWQHAWPQGGDCEYNNETDRGSTCRNDWWTLGLVAWFDQFLKGHDTGILDAPRVQVQDDDGRWRHEQSWPPADVMWHRLQFTEGGQMVTGPGSGTVTYHDYRGGLSAAPEGQANPMVVWQSAPLEQDWTISGQPVFHGNVTATGNRASLILTIAEEINGEYRSINFCAHSLNHVGGLDAGVDSIAGLRQEVEVRCFPQDDVVHAGNRLVVLASGNTIGSPNPSLQPVSDGSEITIDLDGAWMDFPVDHGLTYEDPAPYAQWIEA